MKTNKSRKAGFTLVEIMIVVAIIGLLASIAIPNFVRSRSTAQMNTCINNLRQIDGAKQQWALENGQPGTATPSSTALALYIGRSGTSTAVDTSVYCPIAATKTFTASYNAGIGACTIAPVCSYGGVAGSAYNATFPHVLPN